MQNCKTICHASALLAFAALMAACSKPARISAEIKGAPASEIVLFQQNVNRYDILDTVKTDDSGRFTYKLDIEKGNPDFVYIYKNGHKLASLLLSDGDRVTVSADTSGHYTVSGSAESEKLMEVERKYAEFAAVMDSLGKAVESAGEDSREVARLGGEMTRKYTDYYRQCVRYVMENSRSLTVVPVFYQTADGRQQFLCILAGYRRPPFQKCGGFTFAGLSGFEVCQGVAAGSRFQNQTAGTPGTASDSGADRIS